jgi:hypothetical protein
MKTLKILACGLLLSISGFIHAQVSVNVNVGAPPAWGPVGYSNVEYYYLPDVETYYDVRTTEYIYYGNGAWIRSRRLPPAYRGYDLYSGYKVVLTDYHGPAPYALYKTHKVKYYKGYRGGPQQTIGVRPVKVKHHGHGKGHEKGHGKGHHKH